MPAAGPNTTEVLRWIFDGSKLDDEEEALYAITLVERCLLALLQKLPNSATGAKYLAENQQLVHVVMAWKHRSLAGHALKPSTGPLKEAKRKRTADGAYRGRPHKKRVKTTDPSATVNEPSRATAKDVPKERMSSVPLAGTHKPGQEREANISVRRARSEPLTVADTVSHDQNRSIAAQIVGLGQLLESEESTHDVGEAVAARRSLIEMNAIKSLCELSITGPVVRPGGASYEDRPDTNTMQLYDPCRPRSEEEDDEGEGEGDNEWTSEDRSIEGEPDDALIDDQPLVANRSEWDAVTRDVIVRQTCRDLADWAGNTIPRLGSICEPHLIVARDDDGLTANVKMIQLPEIAEHVRRIEAMQHTMECFVRLNWVGLNVWVEMRKLQLGTNGLRNRVMTRIRDELIDHTLAGDRMSKSKDLQPVKKQWQRRLRAARRWAQLYWHFGAGILLLPRMVFDCKNFGDVSDAEFERAFADWKQNEDLEELVGLLESYAAALFSKPTVDGNEGLVEELKVTYALDWPHAPEDDNVDAQTPQSIGQGDASNA